MKDYIYLSISKKNNIEISNINFPNFITRKESKQAYSLLFKMFNYLGLSININDIFISETGKPYIKNSKIKFNYSHSKNYIACCISNVELGIDIEDEFKISSEAAKLYVPNSNGEYRKEFVTKEAYCKLLSKFNDELFKQLDIKKIKKNKYTIFKKEYDLVLYYEGKSKQINII